MHGNHALGIGRWLVIGGLALALCGEADSREAYGQSAGNHARRAGANSPGRPGQNRLPPRAGTPAARHPDGPRARQVPPGARPVAANRVFSRYHLRAHYWWPYHRSSAPVAAYRSLGYPYYVGGTNYVTLREEGTATTVSNGGSVVAGWKPSTQPAEGEQDSLYPQVLQLAELVHAWRTMNESPQVHERIAAAGTSGEAVEKIRIENAGFDADTRAAARRLAQGESAESELVSASSRLEILGKLMEGLPTVGNVGNP